MQLHSSALTSFRARCETKASPQQDASTTTTIIMGVKGDAQCLFFHHSVFCTEVTKVWVLFDQGIFSTYTVCCVPLVALSKHLLALLFKHFLKQYEKNHALFCSLGNYTLRCVGLLGLGILKQGTVNE